MLSPSDRIRLCILILMTTLMAGFMGCASPVATTRQVSPQKIPKANIVVFPFSSNVGDYPNQRGQFPDREALQIACESQIGKCPFFILLTRDNLDAVLAEQRFQQSDMWSGDSSKIYEVGRALGADHVLVGRFVGGNLNRGWLSSFSLSLKLVDINRLRSTSGYAQEVNTYYPPSYLVRNAVSNLVDNYVIAAQRAYEASHVSERENPGQAIKQ